MMRRAWSTVMPGNSSLAICSGEKPAETVIDHAEAGMRVPTTSHRPDTLPGMRSTSEQFDQSMVYLMGLCSMEAGPEEAALSPVAVPKEMRQ